ncbi:hypothetical protein [Geodermatophilus sp. DSM 44513]|uniref:hypothetical protein n=1 Tax=Geodermatophilus sp. DSM 44513 TaxID=1528104 RepID=UPI001270EFC1|nr:hypothetical protein [Geodermatophilus sp. DSM 44513]WNV77603.1 hypothetical protein RTG05_10085 [Geodermatophilus sp. DSM 44513]
MADDEGAAARRRRPEPADPATLRAWRRTGLVLGTPGALLVVAAVVTGSLGGGSTAAGLSAVGALAAAAAVVFLQRVWSEPRHPRTRFTVVGERAARAFWALWGLGVLLNAVRIVLGVPALVPLQAGVGLLLLAALVVVLVTAARVPAVAGD